MRAVRAGVTGPHVETGYVVVPRTMSVVSGPDTTAPVAQAEAVFTFAAPAGVTFSCVLDEGTPFSCASGTGIPVVPGPHTLVVTPVDAVGELGTPTAPWAWTATSPAAAGATSATPTATIL
jgi:hypothetical protein